MESEGFKVIQKTLVECKKGIEELKDIEGVPQQVIGSIVENLVKFKTSIESVEQETVRLSNENALAKEQIEGTREKAVLQEKRIEELKAENEKLKQSKASEQLHLEKIAELEKEIEVQKAKLKDYENTVTGNEVVDSEIKLMFKEIVGKFEGLRKSDLELSTDITRMITATERTNENSKRAVDTLQKYNKVITNTKEDMQKVLESNQETQILYKKGIENTNNIDSKLDDINSSVENCEKDLNTTKETVSKVSKKVENHESILSKLKGLFK